MSNRPSTGLVTRGRPSLVGKSTTVAKLNGKVYTPLPIAERMLRLVEWPAGKDGGSLLDPSCGDGIFLEAAIRKVAGLDSSRATKMEILAHRLVGWDLDPAAIEACRARLERVSRELFRGRLVAPRLEVRDALEGRGLDPPVGCVVGNPPYLEAKRMPDWLKERIRSACPLAARGAFDLYGAFVEQALRLLGTRSGELCFLIPNRFLVVSYAEALRRELLGNLDVRVIDLSKERVFREAAVYPVVLHAAPPSASPTYTVSPKGEFSSGVSLPSETLLSRAGATMPVAPEDEAGRRLMTRVLREERFRPLSEMAQARWTVSFHRAGLRDRYVFDREPAGGAKAMKFLGGGRFAGNREIQPYRVSWAGSWIDFDEERLKREGNPLPPSSLFTATKLVVCQNARRARAAVDRDGYVLKDTFLAIIPKVTAPALLEWLCVVLNSDVFHYLYEHVYAGTRKGGSYLHFLPRYLGPLPIPPIPDARRVLALEDALSRGEASLLEAEELVRRAYGVTASERGALEEYRFPPH